MPACLTQHGAASLPLSLHWISTLRVRTSTNSRHFAHRLEGHACAHGWLGEDHGHGEARKGLVSVVPALQGLLHLHQFVEAVSMPTAGTRNRRCLRRPVPLDVSSVQQHC